MPGYCGRRGYACPSQERALQLPVGKRSSLALGSQILTVFALSSVIFYNRKIVLIRPKMWLANGLYRPTTITSIDC